MSITNIARPEDYTHSVTQYESLSNSVTTRGRARAHTREDGLSEISSGEALRAVQLADLATYYQQTFGSFCPQCARRDMAAALDEGMSFEVIVIAIDEAAIAPRPSWAYARAILRRCLMEHIHTEEEYNRGQLNYRRSGGRRGHELPF